MVQTATANTCLLNML